MSTAREAKEAREGKEGVKVTVNGEPREIPTGTTVGDLLASVGVNPLLVAVEVNLDILRRAQYPATVLRAGDTVEIVQMVGGGAW